MLQTYYNDIDQALNRVDFSAIWPGYQKTSFALYLEDQAIIDGKIRKRPEAFRGNTALFWEGRHIAIWNCRELASKERLAASLAHEMFHACQLSAGETRFPRDLSLLSAPTDGSTQAARCLEGQLLAHALRDPDPKDALTQFGALRNQSRTAPWFSDLCRAETIEGLAVCAELQVLAQLSPADGQAALEALIQRLSQLENTLPDLRRTAYDTGAAMALATRQAGLDLSHSFTDPKPLFFHLARLLPQIPPPTIPEVPALAQRMKIREDGQRRQIAAFLARMPHCRSGMFHIQGYDPMNQFILDGRLFCTHFLFLEGLGLIHGPCLLALDPKDPMQGTCLWYFSNGTIPAEYV